MTPIERQKLENLKAKAADLNLSEEERKKFARKAMDWADKFPGEKTKMLEEVYSEAKKEEKALMRQENERFQEECLSRPELEEISFTPDVLQQEGVNIRGNFVGYIKAGQVTHEEWAKENVRTDKENYRPYKSFFKVDSVPYVHLMLPKCEDIDYFEHSEIPKYTGNLFAKPYKDGILLVANGIKKEMWGNLTLKISGTEGTDKNLIKGKMVMTMISNAQFHENNIQEISFKNHGQIDWTDKCFDDKVTLYIVVPKMHKTKATKLVIKNNIKLNNIIKRFRDDIAQRGPIRPLPSGKLKYFMESINASSHINHMMYSMNKGEIPKDLCDYMKKEELIKVGHEAALMEIVNFMHATPNKPFQRSHWKLLNKYITLSVEDLKKLYFKYVYPHFEVELSRLNNIPKNIVTPEYKIYCRGLMIKFGLLYSHTNKGETLPNGKLIETKDKSLVDNLLYWQRVNLFELFTGITNTKNYPLLMRNSQIVNDLDFWDEKVENYFSYSMIRRPEMKWGNSFGKKSFDFKDKHILEEIKNNQTGYLMPHDGVFELLHDLVFSAIKFREYEDFITMVIFDDKERYLIEVFDKKTWDFQYKLFDELKFNGNFSDECMQEIYTKLATCIRDAKVLIERDSSMQYQGRRKPFGSKTNSVYHVYFPRVRYRRNTDRVQIKKEKDFFKESRQFSGTRRAHTRRLITDQKPSKKQLLLAKRLDIYVPAGFTFVRESEWGHNMTKREKIYRNTALNGLFYYDNKEMSEAEKINELSPAGFEEYCKEYMKKQGYSIKDSNNYDGGIDIRAVKILDNEETLYAIVQCKHWQKPIPPSEMRDFITACNEEKSEFKKVKIFMSSSKFSPKARSLAQDHDIQIIDGDMLIG